MRHVKDIMTKKPLEIRPDDPLALAVQTMLWSGSRHLPVVSEGDVVGVLSERDTLRFQSTAEESNPLASPVSAAMTAPAERIEPTKTVAEAADKMAKCKIGCLPVIEAGQLVGIVTATDLLTEQFRSASDRRSRDQPLARDLMTKDPLTVTADERLVTALTKMSAATARHLPVVDEKDCLIGMISDRDARVAVGDPLDALWDTNPSPRVRNLRVRDVMTTELVTKSPLTSLAQLAVCFADWRLGAIPIVEEDGRLAGIVSYVDVLRSVTSD